MNSIPWWVFLVVAGVGLLLTLLGKNNKKQGLAFLGSMLQLVGAVLTILSFNNVFRPSSMQVRANAWTVEAHGVAKLINEKFQGKKVAVLGWTRGPDSELPSSDTNPSLRSGAADVANSVKMYMDTLERNGVSAKFVSIATMPPIGMSQDMIQEMLETALDKTDDAEVIVYRNVPLPAWQGDIFSDRLVIQTTADYDETLWDEGLVVAHVVPKPGVDPATYPKDLDEAFKTCFTCKVNSDRD